ncbi:MAG TPA: transporter [Methylococcaceae bacterium]|nr:transporter [Methylococcaceae bacterium]
MMQRPPRFVTGAFLGAALLYSPQNWATHTGAMTLGGGNLSSAINTESAVPIPEGHFAGGLRSEYVRIDRMSEGQVLRLHEAAEEAGEEADLHRVESVLSTSLGIAYGVTDDLTVGLRLPYVWRENVSEPSHHEEGEIERLGDSNGLGDTVVFGQYRFLHLQEQDIHAAVLLGVKTPTGRTRRKTDGEEGHLFEAEQQPGSGSWDGIAGLSYTQVFGPVTFNASTIYTIVTKGTQSTDLGDVFSYNAAVSYRLKPGADHGGGDYFFLSPGQYAVDLVMELNGQWRDRQSVSGEDVENSGAHQLYVSPGVRLTAGQHVNLGLSFGVPIVEHFNGHQDQLDYRAVGTLSFYY